MWGMGMSFYASLDRFQKMKRQRVAYMLDELLERGGEADLNEFIGSIAMNFGIRRKTQEEYLQDLKYAGAIDVRNDNYNEPYKLNSAQPPPQPN